MPLVPISYGEGLVASFVEVLPLSRAQVLGFPDVDDLVARILEQINAGLYRDSIEDVGGQHDVTIAAL